MNDRELLRLAWFCWAAPALVGVGSTVLCLVTGNDVFAFAGFCCALVGTIFFAVGISAAGAAKSGPRLLLTLLLVSNFPLALACATVGLRFLDATMMASD